MKEILSKFIEQIIGCKTEILLFGAGSYLSNLLYFFGIVVILALYKNLPRLIEIWQTKLDTRRAEKLLKIRGTKSVIVNNVKVFKHKKGN